MRTMMFILGMVLVFSIISHPLVIAADVMEIDGTDWEKLGKPSNVKVYFTSGFMSGSGVGYDSIINISLLPGTSLSEEAKDSIDLKEFKFRINLFKRQIDGKLDDVKLKGITVGQLVDGVDEFYKDFSNRRIKIVDTIYVVKMQIKGENSELIDAQIRYLKMQPIDDKTFTEASGRVLFDASG